MQNILLTGATGEVGSQLALELKKQGHNVYCLVRATSEESAQERIDAKLGFGFNVIEGDVQLDHCGLNAKSLTELKGSISKIIHSAALVKFNESLREQIFCTNVTGTKNIIELTKSLDIPELHYVSTAYVAGAAQVFTEKDIGLKENARNPYEESKQEAEKSIRNSGIPYSIYRLGIVVGHSETGETDTFNGYYGYFSGSWHLRDKLRAVAKDTPLQIPANLNGRLNLIQRDWIQDVLTKLLDKEPKNLCFHLVHTDPPNLEWVIRTSYEHLDLPIYPVSEYKAPKLPSREWTIVQNGILREVQKYRVYTDHEPKFCNCLLKETLGADYNEPVPITEDQLHLFLDYALEQKFGKVA